MDWSSANRLLRTRFSTSKKGKVKIVVASENGKEAVVAVMSPGDFFGEGCLIGQPLRLATAISMTHSQIARVSKAEMVRVLHAEPSFAELFMTHLLMRNSRVEEDLVDQLFNSSEKRLARTLLLLANIGKDGGPPADHHADQPRDARRNHRHDTSAGECLHEQIQKIRLH